jgi:hypothetical protein
MKWTRPLYGSASLSQNDLSVTKIYGYRFDHAASSSTWASAGSDAGVAAPYKR